MSETRGSPDALLAVTARRSWRLACPAWNAASGARCDGFAPPTARGGDI